MDFEAIINRNNKENEDVEKYSKEIIDIISKADNISVVPRIIANIFKHFDYQENSTMMENLTIKWSLEYYLSNKIKKFHPLVKILHQYCVDNNFNEDNPWEWGGGDRYVSYIPNPNNDMNVLYYTNQNIKFVCVFNNYYLHLREVYNNILSEEFENYGFSGSSKEYIHNIDELRNELKGEHGIENALIALTNEYSKWANNVEGNKYPNRFDLESMKRDNFSKSNGSFRYRDNRDSGFILSHCSLSQKTEFLDLKKTSYVSYDLFNSMYEIPEEYMKKFKRDETLDNILK